jgi:4-nitrophenyl phosphatase
VLTETASAIERLRAARAWIFDMDGVLYRGDTPLEGVNELLTLLERRDVPYMLATNNSMSTPEQYVVKLAKMGVNVRAEAILTSAMATRDYLLGTVGEAARLFVIGMPALTAQLLDGTGFAIVDPLVERADALVMGLDREITYEKLLRGHRAVQDGARFIATNADVTLPTEMGLVPGCGALVAAVTASTGVTPVIIGKPEVHLLDAAMHRMQVGPEATVMVGDRLDTDIAAGNAAGMLTLLVLTGVSLEDEIGGSPAKPDIVMPDLPAVIDEIASS